MWVASMKGILAAFAIVASTYTWQTAAAPRTPQTPGCKAEIEKLCPEFFPPHAPRPALCQAYVKPGKLDHRADPHASQLTV